MTPIDWKLDLLGVPRIELQGGHHSLVTPIDWKLAVEYNQRVGDIVVATRW